MDSMIEFEHQFKAMDTTDIWGDLKQKMIEEFTPEELDKVKFLIESNLKSILKRTFECQSTNDLLYELEKNMFFEEILSVLEHAFAITNYHTYEGKNFGQMVRDYRHERRILSCSNIIGREAEISKSFDVLANGKNKGLLIYGMGGLGKTLLASELCVKLANACGASILKFDLKQVTDTVDFIKRILAKFEVYTTISDKMALTSGLVDQLKGISNGTCIVLDNIEDVYQCDPEGVIYCIKRFFDMPIRWLITSRIKFREHIHGMEQMELKPLTESDADHLLILSMRPMELGQEKRNSVINMTGRNPLAIRFVSSALKSNNIDDEFGSLAFLNSDLQNGMKECIEYAYMSLTERERVQLDFLSVVETSNFDIEMVKAVLEMNDQEAKLIMMKLTSRQVVQSICYGQYYLHPLIFEYVKNRKGNEECLVRARNNFCQHMIERLKPYIQEADKDYCQAIGMVCDNQPLLKVLFHVLSTRTDDSNNFFTTDTNKYLMQLRDMLPMTQKEKQMLYRRITGQMFADCKKSAYVFWKLEEIRMMVDNNCFADAKREISEIAELFDDDESISFMKGRFLYIKGRFFRCKEYKEYTKAIECFSESHQLSIQTNNIHESAMTLNALGNTYFDMKDVDKALNYHQNAFDLLQKYLLTDHPDLSVYEFNIGSIYLFKASEELSIFKCVTENARENLKKALKYFESSMVKDERMKTHRLPKYGNKLVEKAKAMFYLSGNDESIKEAINVMKESLNIKVAQFTNPDKNKTLELFKTGRTFIRWRQDVANNPTIANVLLKEALHCFRNAENEIKKYSSASLDGTDKAKFISEYRKIASEGLVKRQEAIDISSFCERYERGFSCESSDEYSQSESSNSGNEDSDEGHVSSEDSVNPDNGILSAETEKNYAAEFEKETFRKFSAESTSIDMKKRKHSASSESD